MVSTMLQRELLAADRERALLRKIEPARITQRTPMREQVATALIALALRLAPAAREAIPTEPVATGAAR